MCRFCLSTGRPTPSHDAGEVGGVHRGVWAGIRQYYRHDRRWRRRLTARLPGCWSHHSAPDRRRQACYHIRVPLGCPSSPPDDRHLGLRTRLQLMLAGIVPATRLAHEHGLTHCSVAFDAAELAMRIRQDGPTSACTLAQLHVAAAAGARAGAAAGRQHQPGLL